MPDFYNFKLQLRKKHLKKNKCQVSILLLHLFNLN